MNKTKIYVLICISYLNVILKMLWIYYIVTFESSKTTELIHYDIYSCPAIVTHPFVDTLARWNTTGGSFSCREFLKPYTWNARACCMKKMLHALYCMHGNISFKSNKNYTCLLYQLKLCNDYYWDIRIL